MQSIQDPGSTLGTAYNIGNLGELQSLTEFIGSTDTTDIYKFTVTETSNVDLLMSDYSGNLDLQLIIDSNDNGRIDDGETIYNKSYYGSAEFNSALGAADYFVRVVQESDTTNTSYSLDLSANSAPASIATDPGSTLGTAYNIGNLGELQSLTEFIGSTDTTDIYKFTVTETSNVDLLMSDYSGNLDLQLIIDSNDNGRIDDGETIYNKSYYGSAEFNSPLGAADYFVRVVQESDTTNTNYNLDLSANSAPSSIATDPGNSIGTAYNIGNLGELQSLTEFIGSTDTTDVYKFTVTEISNVDLFMTDYSGNLDLQLIIDSNDNGRIDDGETIYDKRSYGSAEFNSPLGAADYFVRVVQESDTTNTNYNLDLSANSAPSSIATDPGSSLSSFYDIGNLGELQSLTEFIGSTDTTDIYKFTVTEISNVDLFMTDYSGNLDLQLIIDSNDNGRIDDGETIYDKRSYGSAEFNSPLGAADYFVRVVQESDTTNTNYNLDLSANSAPSSIATDPGSSLSSFYDLETINLNTSEDNRNITEFVGSTDTIDVYKFSLLQTTELDLSMTDYDGNLDLQLIVDSNKNGQIDDGETIYDKNYYGSAQFNSALGIADYFVRVVQESNTTNTNYNLNLKFVGDSIDSIITLETLDAEASENDNDTGVFRIRRQGNTSQVQTVNYSIDTGNQQARNGVDYAELSGSVTIPEDRYYVDLVIAPIDDGHEEVLEQVNITLTGVDNDGVLGVEKTARVTISDNDEPQMLYSDVHRFYQYERGYHLYTSDQNEINHIIEKSSTGELSYSYESEQYKVLAQDKNIVTGETIEGVEPIYRFFNTDTGAHLYTMNETEKSYVQANLSNYSFEGIQYYAFESEPENIDTIPVYRMLNTSSGAHSVF